MTIYLLLLSLSAGVSRAPAQAVPAPVEAPSRKSPGPLIAGVALSVIYLVRRRGSLRLHPEGADQPGTARD